MRILSPGPFSPGPWVAMTPADRNPILPFMDRQGFMILDGGLATALEARGCDLVDELWSAKVLLENPELIREVHLDFLRAGADCIATSSYQASVPGFQKRGLDEGAALGLLRLSVTLALEARDSFWSRPQPREERLKPLVAASIGPYGAYLADGSEYTGDYGITDAELYNFHRERWSILAAGGVDLMACETIPAQGEVEVLLRLLSETPGAWAWLSFSCKDGRHLCDGGLLRDAVRACHGEPGVAAVGVNCTPPELIPELIDEARSETNKPILVYPNSGEAYDAETKMWGSFPSGILLAEVVKEWVLRGASGVGGCCRVGPETIAEMRRSLTEA
jgi:homocysteine S-methyltransferase